MKQLQFQRRLTLIAGITFVLLTLLACTGGGLTAARTTRSACPSPTPLPFGEGGPVKRKWQECTTDPITGVQTCETRREYYAEWEQEYPDLGGPPFPSPTPDAMYGTSYAFGQRVEVWPLHSGLQNTDAQDLVVQWSNVTLRDRSCGSPGALTGWGDTENPGALVAPAPEGTNRLLQVALNQVGKPYVWGAKGPERFDCSGLTQWSYGQIGIRIPTGTAGQWPQMRAVEAAALQPGDLIFFASAGGRIDHVGLVGDFNDDRRWDLLHAASPQLGVRIDYSVFQSAYYGPRIRGFRTAR